MMFTQFISNPPRAAARRLALLLVVTWCVGAVPAQFDGQSRISSVYPDISIEASTHLRTAASYVADQNWTEAVELYQKLIERYGDKVVQLESRPLFVTVRDFCHMKLVAMPPRALELYRQRVDAQAEAWYSAGLRSRDRELLSRVVDQAFASSWGDNALDSLAEIAFESGDFAQASMAWGRIFPDVSANNEPDGGPAAQLVYPDSDLDRPLIEAKRILCALFDGGPDRSAAAISRFRRRFPMARGVLGGTEGLLAERLERIARDAASVTPPEDNDWTTFAGNTQRTKVVTRSVDIGSVQWTAQLPQVVQTRINFSNRPVSNNPDDQLSFHPLVLRDQVIVAGRDEVRAYDLHEGPAHGDEPIWTFRLRDSMGQGAVVTSRPSAGSPQFTLTAHRGRLYVRMGAPETTLPIRRGGQPDSFLVCLDLSADGKELWRIQPEPAEPDLAFEGSPVVADGNVYIGVTRGGAMTHSFLACYDAETGVKKWRTLICESSSTTSFFNAGSISHNLPTLGGGLVFYNTNLGAVSAIDQRTGRVRWIATYARKGRDDPAVRSGPTSGRELSPCVYWDGLVFALPADGEGVHAFDSLTGELRWRTPEPPNFAYMLGVAHGNLICSGSRVVAIDVATGKPVWQWSDSSSMSSFGRGVLAGDFVYFPTKTHVYILDQRTGVLAKPKEFGAIQERHMQSPGNLVIGDGYLVVAQPKSLAVFCQYEVLINRYRELIAQRPDDPEPHLRLARAAEATGSKELAVEHYRTAIQLASAEGTAEDRTTRLSARAQLHTILQHLGQEAEKSRDWARADGYLREAATVAPTVQAKLDVTLRIAELWDSAGDPAKALGVYQDLLGDDTFRGVAVAIDGNRTVRADVEISSRVNGLLDRAGRALYARYEATALRAFAEAQQQDSIAAMERLLRTHPNSDAATQALLYLAGQYFQNKQPGAAAAAYKQVIERPKVPAASQVLAISGLAQLHEDLQAWQTARSWWQRLAIEFPDAAMPNHVEQSVQSFVQERLGRAPYESNRLATMETLQLPLARRWNRQWEKGHRIVIPEGSIPGELGLLLLVTDSQSAECLSVRSGQPAWSIKVDGPVRWAAFYEDRLITGTNMELNCLSAATGELIWQQRASSGSAGFSEFRLVDDRLFVREDTRQLQCIAAATGIVAWTYAPAEGFIQPHTFFGARHLALNTKQPAKMIVLDGDGRRRFEMAQSGDAWEFPPIAIDAHRLCMASDARTIQVVDLSDGRQVWSYAGPTGEQRPVPIASATALLALFGGRTLVRLDPETGKPLWTARVSDDELPRYGSAWTISSDLFCCITRELNLRAFRLNDGVLAWEQALTGPGDQWQLAVSGEVILALPRRPHSSDGMPVVACRQSDGRLLQRLFFRPHGSEAIVHLTAQDALVGSERDLWVLRRPE